MLYGIPPTSIFLGQVVVHSHLMSSLRLSTRTKICKDLLPTTRILYRWKQQGHDSCSLCGKEETTEHMILCDHPSWLKLCLQFLTSLQDRLQTVNTQTRWLMDTSCSAISDWFDYGAVDPDNYPSQYHQAILQARSGPRCHDLVRFAHLFLKNSLKFPSLNTGYRVRLTVACSLFLFVSPPSVHDVFFATQ